MSDKYRVIEVRKEWQSSEEEMGSKTKFWYCNPSHPHRHWLFKYPQENTGQHWAEKIAAEIAAILDIDHARVELATANDIRGSVTESFAVDGWELYHGNQLLKKSIFNYDPDLRFRQSSHTLSNIWQVMENLFLSGEVETFEDVALSNETTTHAKSLITEFIVLDALIANTDRHHENWGILRRFIGDDWEGHVAPSFDHASSLGRELLDSHRARLIAERRVGNYVEKGRGGIYYSELDRRGPSPLELVRRAAQDYRNLLQPALSKLRRIDSGVLAEVIDRVPENWMSEAARAFALALMCYTHRQLEELVQ